VIAWVLAGAVVFGSGQVVARGEQPAWSPQGKLAYVLDGRIHVGGRSFPGQWPAWSPDGKRLAFTRWSTVGWSIWIARPDGSGAKLVAKNAQHPTWSRDGLIAFWSDRGGADSDVWTMHADGTHLRRLHKTVAVDNWGPAWSPDGKTIAFVALQRGSKWVYTIRSDGSGLRRVAKGEQPAFRP
jgi:Tol biopolymer transport system component